MLVFNPVYMHTCTQIHIPQQNCFHKIINILKPLWLSAASALNPGCDAR